MSNILPSDSQAQVDSRWCDWCGEVHGHKQTCFVWDEYSRREKYGYLCWFTRIYPGWSRWAFLLALLSVTAWPIFGVTELFMHLHVSKDGTRQSMVGVHWWLQAVWLTIPFGAIAMAVGGRARDVLKAMAGWAIIATCIFVGTHSFIPAWVWAIGAPKRACHRYLRVRHAQQSTNTAAAQPTAHPAVGAGVV